MASIAKRSDGKWRARYREESGKEVAKHFTRKSDAQAWLDSVTTAVGTGTYISPAAGRETLAEFYAGWADRQIWEATTRRAMDLAVKSVTFSKVPLRNVRESHVQHWVKRMDGTLAASTIRTRFNNVRAVLRAAVADKVIAQDPSAGVKLPRQRRADMAMVIPTPQDVGRVLGAADGEFEPFVALCAFAGLRLGEAAAVQIGDVDFLRRRLAVSRQVQRGPRGSVDIRPPKYGSERVVYIPDGLSLLLAGHIEEHLEDTDPDRWLFVGQSDDPPHQNTVGYRWRRLRERAGLPELELHSLRHFFASGLIAAGCDVVTVQRAMGHAKPTTTLQTYAHLWPTAEDRTRAAAEGLMGACLDDESTPADQSRTEAAKQGV